MNDQPVVLYHASCSDGFGAAWVANKTLAARNPIYLPVNYGQEPPAEAFSGRGLYILDFSYPAEVMERLCSLARFLVCLDHHKSAKAVLEPLAKFHAVHDSHVQIHFDLTKSGARLTWEHFNSKAINEAPSLVAYVEDRDLWKWALPDSKAVNAYIRSWPMDFFTWDRLDADLRDEQRFAQSVAQGEAILRYQAQVLNTHVKNAIEVTVGGHKVLCVNATTLISEIGEALAKDRPFGATWFQDKLGRRIYSLRSRQGGVDVSEVARQYGGGGHIRAAGFELEPGQTL